MVKAPKETLLEQERFELKPKSGGEILSYEAMQERFQQEWLEIVKAAGGRRS